MAYELTFSKQAFKELSKINEPYYSNLKKAIYDLSENPKPIGCIKLKGRDGYRIRIANYRVIYDIYESELIIEIITVGHRKDIYL